MKNSTNLNKGLTLLLICCLCCICAPWQAQAQYNGTVFGRLVSKNSVDVANTAVMLKENGQVVTADKSGRFEVTAPAGDYTLVISSAYIPSRKMNVTVRAGHSVNLSNIVIDDDCQGIDEVVVTGQYSAQSLRNSLYKIRVINNQNIQQKGATDLQSLLNTELGIRLSNDMTLGETNFEVMGMSGNNVKVLLDGVPMIDRNSTKQSLSQIDINTIDRIEIVEGPMSVIYGADALAGVINIITKHNDTTDNKRISAHAKIQEESIGDEYELFTGKGRHIQNVGAEYRFRNRMYLNAYFTHDDFGGWRGDSTGRKKQWQPKEQFLYGGKIGYSSARLNIYGRLDYVNEMITTEDDINTVTNTTSDKKFIVNRYTGQLQASWKVSDRVDLNVAGSYQDYKRETQTVIINLNNGRKTLSREDGAQATIKYNDYFARATATWRLLDNLTIQPGAEFQSSNGTGDRVDGEHRINNTAVFLSAEYAPVSWLSIRPGLRKAFSSVYDVPAVIPSVNVKFKLHEDMDLRLSYGRGFRAPTLQELYYSFHDANHDIDGNPDLKAEHSNSYMASYVWRAIDKDNIRLASTLSGFYNDYRNRISLAQDLTTGYYRYHNIDRYKTVGFTFENSFSYGSLNLAAAFSYVGRYNSLYRDETYAGEDMSRYRFSPEVTASASYNWDRVATFSFYYKMTGRRHEYIANSDNTVSLGGMNSFNWADFTVSRKVWKYLTVQAGIKNIFDITTVRNSSSTGGAHSSGTGVSQMACGRSYFVALSFNY